MGAVASLSESSDDDSSESVEDGYVVFSSWFSAIAGAGTLSGTPTEGVSVGLLPTQEQKVHLDAVGGLPALRLCLSIKPSM